nr:hypothetical protein L203_06633 [Cryptococcus depauperatus CBS 7841]
MSRIDKDDDFTKLLGQFDKDGRSLGLNSQSFNQSEAASSISPLTANNMSAYGASGLDSNVDTQSNAETLRDIENAISHLEKHHLNQGAGTTTANGSQTRDK